MEKFSLTLFFSLPNKTSIWGRFSVSHAAPDNLSCVKSHHKKPLQTWWSKILLFLKGRGQMNSGGFERLCRGLKSLKPTALTIRLPSLWYWWPAGSLVKQSSVWLALSGAPLEGAIETQSHCRLEKILLSLCSVNLCSSSSPFNLSWVEYFLPRTRRSWRSWSARQSSFARGWASIGCLLPGQPFT